VARWRKSAALVLKEAIMRMLLFSLLAIVAPTNAFALTDAERANIAEALSKAYKSITVTAVSAPLIRGDKDPAIFRITPAGKPNFGNLFLKGRYDIIHKPDSIDALGGYFCTIADEFVRERRSSSASGFLRGVSLRAGLHDPVTFEIEADRDTVHDMVAAVLRLWDYVRDDYEKFDIFVRGYADRGASFQKPLLQQYPYSELAYFPLETPNDPMLAGYLRKIDRRKIGSTYTNADLPDLRATFLKHAIDVFLRDCGLDGHLTPQSHVLDGAVIDENAPDYRTIDLYFYAHQ